ncbi:PucR family transcriptional regulator ligand-binding domain-containing protein [Saccharopolyspora shandongensis]|uniref:PucR family transcriptional regulator ligand-binding domain-containing protein n=1 Tax=Saccharopolyspora shandongensis TaxID=418495 RepID=UPI0034025DC6
MLMTNGMSFPSGAEDQEKLVERLVEAGASALAIGERMHCPPLRRQLEQASERLRLPVLWIRYPLPFVAISRAVAEATLLEQSQRLIKTQRIYDAIRRTTSRAALELSQTQLALEQQRRCGAELLNQLLDGRIDPQVGHHQLLDLHLHRWSPGTDRLVVTHRWVAPIKGR